MVSVLQSTFSKKLKDFLIELSTNPNILRKSVSTLLEVKTKLYSQGDSLSQGTGNQVTDQETCFAAALENYGFKYSSSNVPVAEDGLYYIYQVNGTQRSIDFQVFVWANGTKQKMINFDLKHTKNETFFLNDGWFHDNIIYIISWMRKISEPRKRKVVEPATFIAFGQDIPTEDEIALYEELCEIKKKYNTDYKGSGSFHCYLRFANTYKCERFTPEYTATCLESVLTSIRTRKRPIIVDNLSDSLSSLTISSSPSSSSPSSPSVTSVKSDINSVPCME
jgi:hypothetical protein